MQFQLMQFQLILWGLVELYLQVKPLLTKTTENSSTQQMFGILLPIQLFGSVFFLQVQDKRSRKSHDEEWEG